MGIQNSGIWSIVLKSILQPAYSGGCAASNTFLYCVCDLWMFYIGTTGNRLKYLCVFYSYVEVPFLFVVSVALWVSSCDFSVCYAVVSLRLLCAFQNDLYQLCAVYLLIFYWLFMFILEIIVLLTSFSLSNYGQY